MRTIIILLGLILLLYYSNKKVSENNVLLKTILSSAVAILSIIFCFLCAMLMDTRAGFLIFAVCGIMLPFAIGIIKTVQYVAVTLIFSIISTTIIIDEPLWVFEAFGSLFNVFSLEGGSYLLEYYDDAYYATKGDIGRYSEI